VEEHDGREIVARSCRILGLLGLTKVAMGHVSQLSEDRSRILIRARGPEELGVRYTTAKEIITVDKDGRKIDGPDGLLPPAEVFIHTWLYRTRPDIRSVVHIHPPTLVLFTVCDKPLLPIYGAFDLDGLNLLIEGVPTYERSILITNDELGRELSAVMDVKPACLMRGHGITTVGASVEEATITAIRLNELAEMNYRAYQLGNPRPIPEEDMVQFRNLYSNGNRAAAQARIRSAWRYYSDLLSDERV